MSKFYCSGFKPDEKPCRRSVKNEGGFCKDHKDQDNSSIFLIIRRFVKNNYKYLFALLVSTSIGLCNYYKPSSKLRQTSTNAISTNECNRFSEGCVLNLSPSKNKNCTGFSDLSMISISAGKYGESVRVKHGQYVSFPVLPRPYQNVKSPFSFTIKDSLVLIRGKIEDYVSSARLGAFNENEFVILKKDGVCAFSYNKDVGEKNYGIEIINNDLEVCFSLDIINHSWLFKGYFKDKDNNIYIFNDSVFEVTKDIAKAKKIIRNINYVFEHESVVDSLGKRINYPPKNQHRHDMVINCCD